MKKYNITIKLTDGREIRSSVVARNQNDALRRLENSQQVIDFLSESDAAVASIDIQSVAIKSIDNSRFYVTNIKNKEGWYVVADLENRIKVEFKKGHYNDIQKVETFKESKEPDALKIATALREIGEFMKNYFKDLI